MGNITKENNYNGHPLSTTFKNDQGFRTVILDKIFGLLDHMTKHHSKVFFTMFELNYPANSSGMYPDNNALMSMFTEALMTHYERAGHDPKYLWVRERSSTGQFHYHIMVLLDGNKTQNVHGLHAKAIELWGRRLGRDGNGYVQLCRSNVYDNGYGGVQLIRNSPVFQQMLEHCFQWASYLAKCYSKGDSPAYINEYGYSRLWDIKARPISKRPILKLAA
jgi:hypothetical protein